MDAPVRHLEMRRDWMPSGALTKPATGPLFAFVENGAANDSGNGARSITPDEMICAIWSTIIHGARLLFWFYYADIVGLSAGNAIYDATKSINTLVTSLAPVLNSPFSLGYVSVSPKGYEFPSLDQTAWKAWTNLGIQYCAKWYNNKFYIIASTTYGEAGYTTKTGTFTIKNTGATVAPFYIVPIM